MPLYAPIEGREWPPFAIGSFVFGPFDFQRIIEAENDPSVFGFSLEFSSDVAGTRGPQRPLTVEINTQAANRPRRLVCAQIDGTTFPCAYLMHMNVCVTFL